MEQYSSIVAAECNPIAGCSRASAIGSKTCCAEPMLGLLVDRKVAPHVSVFDKAARSGDTWVRAPVEWDAENDLCICPEGPRLKQARETALTRTVDR